MAQVRLNLLLMGKTGNGKSRTGNNLLGSRAFEVSYKPESETKEVQQSCANFDNYILKIVDLPGLQDTTMDKGKDKERTAANMAQALALCDGGVDAFLFVCRYGVRFTNDERDTLDCLKHIFGEKFYNHLIVVLTMGDLFKYNMEAEGNSNFTFLDWCRQQTGSFKQLFDDSRGRCVMFNNREKDEDKMNKQRKELCDLSNQVQKIHGRYTNQIFEAAKELREQYIVENKVSILAGQIQEKCSVITTDVEKYVKAPTEQGQLKMSSEKLNLVLIGRIGSGKSSLGNNILGKRAFPVSSIATVRTSGLQTCSSYDGNYILQIVDGLRLIDTDKNRGAHQESVVQNMALALNLCDGSIDAFLFVCRYGVRFTEEDKAALDGLKHILGEKYYNHMIVVLTMGDLFIDDMEDEGNSNFTFLDWCMQQTGPFKQLFDDCGGRFVIFNNREKNLYFIYGGRNKIIELASEVRKINGRYTYQTLEAAEESRNRYIVERNVPILTEKVHAKCYLFMADLENYKNSPTEQDKLKIQQSLAALKEVLLEEGRGTNLLHELHHCVYKVEEKLYNIDQLYKRTRQSKNGCTAF